jgi:hypothetical protein
MFASGSSSTFPVTFHLLHTPHATITLLSISEMGHFVNRTLWHHQMVLASSLRQHSRNENAIHSSFSKLSKYNVLLYRRLSRMMALQIKNIIRSLLYSSLLLLQKVSIRIDNRMGLVYHRF